MVCLAGSAVSCLVAFYFAIVHFSTCCNISREILEKHLFDECNSFEDLVRRSRTEKMTSENPYKIVSLSRKSHVYENIPVILDMTNSSSHDTIGFGLRRLASFKERVSESSQISLSPHSVEVKWS
ncbi:hypothetical protein AB6A40_004600 [Gnathostoma spinigerum]|uniref:Uncharacterized protein n=1 Tax=Gnathostoma spinigerum TaxID=75299 RepID=A0ABD6EKE4_9BILA